MKRQTSILFILLVFLLPTGLLAQDSYQLTSDSKITLYGTSNVHDWEMVSQNPNGTAKFVTASPEIQKLTDLRISLDVESLKSGKKGLDKNAYKAIDTDKHPKITFQMTKLNSITPKGTEAKVTVTGNLTVAGVTKTTVLEATCKLNKENIKCSGEHPLKMTDHNVDPPKFMMGAMKTGDDLRVSYEVQFAKK